MSVLLLSAEYYSKVCIVTVYLFPLVKSTSLPPAPQPKNATINHVVFCENFHGIYVPRGGTVGWWTSGFWILLDAEQKLPREVVLAYTSQHHWGSNLPAFQTFASAGECKRMSPLNLDSSDHCWSGASLHILAGRLGSPPMHCLILITAFHLLSLKIVVVVNL